MISLVTSMERFFWTLRSTWKFFHFDRISILTSHQSKIQGTITIPWRNKSYKVHMEEEVKAWIPNFLNSGMLEIVYPNSPVTKEVEQTINVSSSSPIPIDIEPTKKILTPQIPTFQLPKLRNQVKTKKP